MLNMDGLPREIPRMPSRTYREALLELTQAVTEASKVVSKSDE